MRRLITTLLCCCLTFCGLWAETFSDSGGQGESAWANPAAQALRRVGQASDVPEQPNFQSNLDCNELTYRQTNSTVMQAGCFVPAAYGLVDPDSDTVIFNGTDEALPIRPYTAHQVLTAWPGTVNALSMTAASTGGSYLSLYRNLVADLRDERDLSGQLIAKQLTAPPDLTLVGASGQPMVINAQTVAFSANGSWLVVETLTGAFVRINLATLDMTAFAPAYGSQGSPALLKSQVAVSEDGRYVAIENTTAGAFKVYDLSRCSAPTDSLHPQDCATYDYWPFVASQVAGLTSITHVRFVTTGLLEFDAGTSTDASTYVLAPTNGINALTDYLAIGDSYTSGEGAYDYAAGTDTGEDVCHVSVRSYPLLISAQLFADGHSVACSGARMQDIMPSAPNNYRGQVAGGIPKSTRSADSVARILADFTPGYLAQADFVSQYQPEILTVSVGGDDIGFGDMIQNCVEPHVSLHLSDSTCFDTYEDRLELKALVDRTMPKWAALFRRLQDKSPLSRVYAIGYPQIAVDTGNCAANVHLNKGELEFSEEIVSYLNDAIKQAAAAAGVSYIDIAQALAGHRLCETDSYNVAVNGLTAGSDGGPFGLKIFGKESYHPNALGQALIAEAVLKQSHNLAPNNATDSGASSPNSSDALLNAPRSGRSITARVPDPDVAPRVINRGAVAALAVDGPTDGLRPDSSYAVHLDGAGGSAINQVGSDQTGSIDSSVIIPDGTAPGGHSIDIVGPGQGSEVLDVTQSVYIAANGTDADGDGVPDTDDACPGASNSSQDIDGDGVDDACDGEIGPAAGNSSGLGSPQNSDSGPGVTVAASPQATDSTIQVPLPDNEQKTNITTTRPVADVGILRLTASSSIIGWRNLYVEKTAVFAHPDSASAGQIAIRSVTNKHQRTTAAGQGKPNVGRRLGPYAMSTNAAKTVSPYSSRWFWAAAIGCWLLLLLILIMRRTRKRLRPAGNDATRTKRPPTSEIKLFGFRCAASRNSCTIGCMIWVRKGVVHLLSLILFSALLGGVVATSIDIAFSHPAKVETWLAQSNLYSSFVTNAVKQANTSTDNGGQNNGISLNDVAVQQAAEAAFSPALLQQDVKTFLDSNYAWLEGKTATPNFSIDLSSAKESFAQKVGQYVQTHLAGLPVCTTAQALAQSTTDPLAMACRPAVLDPAVAGAQATQQVEAASGFLNNPVITANSINQNGGNGQPYYKSLSKAPRIYRAATTLPWVLAAISLLCAVGIFFVAPRKRRGLRRIGFVLLEVGILLTVMKFVADEAFKQVENKLFNQAINGPLQQALTGVAHKAESQLVNVNMYFGITFIVLAVIIFVVLIVTRGRSAVPAKPGSAATQPEASAEPKTDAQTTGTTSADGQPRPTVNRSKRPPRLIQ